MAPHSAVQGSLVLAKACLFARTLSLSLLKHRQLAGADKANSLCVAVCAPLHAGLACFISGFRLNKDSSPKQRELYINY